MPYDYLFGLFQDDEDRSIWRGSFAELDDAKRKAQQFADEESQEFFVCRFEDHSEVARLFPTRSKSPSGTGLDRSRLAAEQKEPEWSNPPHA